MVHGAEAPSPAAGYIYQLRYALWRGIERLRRDPTASIAIEKLDDIAILGAGKLTAIEQLKHTTQAAGQISDSSKALWRTLGNWCRLIESKKVTLTRVDFLLTTNASVAPDSALSKLSTDDASRDVQGALITLAAIASSSANKDTAADRTAFLNLNPAERSAFLGSIRVADSTASLHGLSSELDAALYLVCDPSQVSQLRQELEGWWTEQVSAQLAGGVGAVMQLVHLEGRIAFLREKYKSSLLQFDEDEEGEEPIDLDGYVFVDQLSAIAVGKARIANAQRIFMKASAQRSRWLRGAKLDPEELSRYDEDLVDRWTTHSAICWDEIEDDSVEADRIAAGRTLLQWAETQETPLKGASSNFLTGGSFHSLANLVRVGWHPAFEAKFKK